MTTKAALMGFVLIESMGCNESLSKRVKFGSGHNNCGGPVAATEPLEGDKFDVRRQSEIVRTVTHPQKRGGPSHSWHCYEKRLNRNEFGSCTELPLLMSQQQHTLQMY